MFIFISLFVYHFEDKRYKIIYNAFKTYLMLTPFFVSLWIWLRSKASCDYQERFLLQYHMSQGYNNLVLSIVQYIHLGYTIHLHSCLISNLAKKVSKTGKICPLVWKNTQNWYWSLIYLQLYEDKDYCLTQLLFIYKIRCRKFSVVFAKIEIFLSYVPFVFVTMHYIACQGSDRHAQRDY